MNLFIDTISKQAKLIIFNESREILDESSWEVRGNESSTLIPKIDELLKNNNIEYKNLDNLVIVNGPGSFTGVRTSVLAINSINYIINKNITTLSYFDMFNSYPIIKSSSKRDCFVKYNENSNIEIIANNSLIESLENSKITKVYGEANTEIFSSIEILENIDYTSIIKNVKFDNLKVAEPLYIKKPNIS